MMASKARLFDDQPNLDRILNATSPLQCKALGRDVRNYVNSAWVAARFDVVTRASIVAAASLVDPKLPHRRCITTYRPQRVSLTAKPVARP